MGKAQTIALPSNASSTHRLQSTRPGLGDVPPQRLEGHIDQIGAAARLPLGQARFDADAERLASLAGRLAREAAELALRVGASTMLFNCSMPEVMQASSSAPCATI